MLASQRKFPITIRHLSMQSMRSYAYLIILINRSVFQASIIDQQIKAYRQQIKAYH